MSSRPGGSPSLDPSLAEGQSNPSEKPLLSSARWAIHSFSQTAATKLNCSLNVPSRPAKRRSCLSGNRGKQQTMPPDIHVEQCISSI